MQSHNYKPGVSGWRFDKASGDFEFNTTTHHSESDEAKPQELEVTVFDVSVAELPTSGRALYDFLYYGERKAGRDVDTKVEFYTEWAGEHADHRVRMTYRRLETMEELCARLQRAEEQKPASSSVVCRDGTMAFYSRGVKLMEIGNPAADEPFVVSGGKVEISRTIVDAGAIKAAQIVDPHRWTVRMSSDVTGKPCAVGIGVGPALAQPGFVDQVRDVLRRELAPGGLLYRR